MKRRLARRRAARDEGVARLRDRRRRRSGRADPALRGDRRVAGTARVDLFLGAPYHDRGLGTDAVRTMARHLIDDRGHHRLTIDPAAHNERAIRAATRRSASSASESCASTGSTPDGVWRDGLLARPRSRPSSRSTMSAVDWLLESDGARDRLPGETRPARRDGSAGGAGVPATGRGCGHSSPGSSQTAASASTSTARWGGAPLAPRLPRRARRSGAREALRRRR